MRFLKNIAKKVATPIASEKGLKRAQQENNLIAVFFGEANGTDNTAFVDACRGLPRVNCYQIVDDVLQSTLNVEEDMVLYKRTDEADPPVTEIPYTGEMKKDAIRQFIVSQSEVVLPQFLSVENQRVFKEGEPALIVFRGKTDTTTKDLVKAVAVEQKGKILVATADIAEGFGKEIAKLANITAKDLPEVILIK